MATPNELAEAISGYTGTDWWYAHQIVPSMLYTDGVRAFANIGGAYWLLDIIATEVFPLLKDEPFIDISVTVDDCAALIAAGDGNGKRIWSRNVEFTDLPKGVWKFFLTGNVLLLPSEY